MKRFRLFTKNILLNCIASRCITISYVQKKIFELYGYKIHKSSKIHPLCFFGFGKGRIIMDKHSFCNSKCFFDLSDDIIIGKNVAVGMNVTFLNSTHKLGDSNRRAKETIGLPIIIEDGCWIGANVVIMPGVTIKKGCVIGATALVTKDTEPNGLYVGKPAHKIKDLI